MLEASLKHPTVDDLKRLDERLLPLVHRLADATVPLCQPQRRRPPSPAGSAVLIQIAGRRYMLTASHVFDHANPERPIAAVAGGGFWNISGFARWRTRAGLTEAEDRTDLAIVRLDRADSAPWERCTFLGLDEFDPFGIEEELSPNTAFLAIGYPNSQQPKIVRQNSYEAFTYHFLTNREPIHRDNGLGVDPARHILIGYDTRGFVSQARRSQVPSPVGMSGGGLWRVPRALTSRAPAARLIGILIEYHASPHHVIVATRISNPLRALAHFEPEIADVIDNRFPGLTSPAA